MGLDVTAYRRIKKLDVLFDASGEPVDPGTMEPHEDYFKALVNPNFFPQAAGLEDESVYGYVESERFWSGSYGTYGSWREQLAKLAGYRSVYVGPDGKRSHQVGACQSNEGPFHELICFTDSDGVIGAKVSAKLARDFAAWDDRAKETRDDWFYQKYAEWRRCFEMAADDGAVSFH